MTAKVISQALIFSTVSHVSHTAHIFQPTRMEDFCLLCSLLYSLHLKQFLTYTQ